MICKNVNQRAVSIVWHHRIFWNWKFFIIALSVDLGGTLENSGTAVPGGSLTCGCPLHSRIEFEKMLTLRFIIDFSVSLNWFQFPIGAFLLIVVFTLLYYTIYRLLCDNPWLHLSNHPHSYLCSQPGVNEGKRPGQGCVRRPFSPFLFVHLCFPQTLIIMMRSLGNI